MPNDPIQHLSNLAAVEVSYVPRGANGKTFLILKEDASMPVDMKSLDAILKADLQNEAQIDKILKDASIAPAQMDQLKAALRVLQSMGSAINPQLLAEVTALAGGAPAAPAAPVAAAAPAAPAPAAAAPAPAAGHAPPPAHAAPAPAAKSAVTPTTPPPPGDPAATQPPQPVKKEDAVDDLQIVLKADGTIDEEKIPAPIRATVVKLWTDANAKTAELVKVQKALDEERDVRITKEYQERADALTNLPGKKEELGAVLKELAVTAPKTFDRVEAVLKAANEALKASPAFNETGSGATGGTGAKIGYDAIEQAAMNHPIAKALGSKSEAVTHFITKVAEGREMYSAFKAAQS